MTPLFYTFRDREEILKIFEKYCGARLTTHAFRIGGCQYETYAGFEKDVKNFLTFFAPKIDEYEDAAHQQPHLAGAHQKRRRDFRRGRHCARRDRAGAARQRREVGPPQGPALRELLRSSISKFRSAQTATPTTGTWFAWPKCASRCASFEQAVDGIPEGPIMAKVPKVIKPPVGEIYHSIEAPKGELGYFIVSDGSTQPYRLRVRPPSFVNLQALDVMVRGMLVADVVAVIGTIDIVLGEVDR